MASVRMQIFDYVESKLQDVQEALGWKSTIRDPRELVGEDQMDAIILATGGETEPGSLTGHVSTHFAEFEVGLMVLETRSATAEQLLDAGFVAVCDALLDPADMQLGGLAVGIQRGGMSPPFVGRSQGPDGRPGAHIIGAQAITFSVEYWGREGDASTPGP